MSVGCAVWTEGDDDVGSPSSDRQDNVADQLLRVGVREGSVAIVFELDVGDAEEAGRGEKLIAPQLSKLFARGNWHTRTLARIAGRRAEETHADALSGVFRDDATSGERLVVGVGEDAREAFLRARPCCVSLLSCRHHPPA